MENIDRSTPIAQINTKNNTIDSVNNILQNFNELNEDQEPPAQESYEYEYAQQRTTK